MIVVYIINNGEWSIHCFLFGGGWVNDRERSRVVEKLQTQINHETFHLDLCWF